MRDAWFESERSFTEGRLEVRSKPHVFTLGLTNKCNLDCVMCFSREQPQIDMSSAIIEKLRPYLAGASSIHWNDAGEIFASSRTAEFLKLMRDIRPPRSLLSSNFLLADRWMEELFATGVTDLAISIDAATGETYEKIRRRGSWSKLMSNLDQFVTMRRSLGRETPKLSFIFVAMNHNVHEIPAFVELAARYEAPIVQILRMLTTPEILMLTDQPDASVERHFFEEGLRRARQLGIRLEHTWLPSILPEDIEPDLPPSEDVLSSESHSTDPGKTNNSGFSEDTPYPALMAARRSVSGYVTAPCPAPWREMLVQYDGLVRPCCYSNRILGDLNHQSVEEVWNGDAYREFRINMLTARHDDCIGCPILTANFRLPEDPVSVQLGHLSQTDTVESSFSEHEQGWQDFKVAAKALRVKERSQDTLLSRLRRFGRSCAMVSRDLLHFPGLLRRHLIQEREERLSLLRLLSVTAERVRSAEETIRLLVEAIQRQQHQIAIARGVTFSPSKESAVAVHPDSRLNALFFNVAWLSHETPPRLEAGERLSVPVSLMNTSTASWPTGEPPAVFLSYSWRDGNGDVVVHDGIRSSLPSPSLPFEELSVMASLEAPEQPGDYILSWDLVYERVAWFRHRGCSTLDVDVTIR